MPTKKKKNAYKSGQDIFKRTDDNPLAISNYHPLQRLSYAKKKANDFRWAEKCADFFDYYYGYWTDDEKRERLALNYNLFNGRGEEAMDEYRSDANMQDLIEEGIDLELNNIQHHPLIDQIAKAMVGEQQRRPLTPQAIDTSGYSVNYRKKKRLELLQGLISKNILEPIQQEATMNWMRKNNIEDPYSLTPDEQIQAKEEIAQEVKIKTPKDIENYMRSEYKSPPEKLSQKLLDYLMQEYDIKFLTDEGFKHGIITGEEVYYVGVRHNKPVLELVNPVNFQFSAKNNSLFVEDAEWAKYEEYIKYTDLFNQYGDILTEADYKKLNDIAGLGIGSTNYRREQENLYSALENNVAEYDSRTGFLDTAPDIRTKQGQDWVRNIYGKFGTDRDGYSTLRKVHIVWKSLRKLKRIFRVNPNGGEESFWVDESYTLNKLKGDLRQETAWIPVVWETTKIGTSDGIYLNKRRVPFQNRSLSDPWDVKLPYIGMQYSRLMGNSKNVAPMDLGKPWQYKFNVQMAKIHEMEATDVGNILLYAQNAKPKDWSWGKFLKMIKYGKIAPISLNQEGTGPVDAQVFKSINLSNINDLAGKLQYLEFIRNQVALAMSYNPSRLGMVAPNVAVTNNQQNIVQSSYQTQDLYTIHNKVIENVLNALVRAARIAYKDNEFAKTYILDDMSVAELELDWEMLDGTDTTIKIRNSSEDFANIEQIKQLGQAMVQNGLISFPELIKFQWAKSGSEMMNIAEQAEERVQRMREQQAKQQQEQVQAQMQMQAQLLQQQQEFDLLKQRLDHQNNLQKADIDADRFRRQQDVNLNKVDDDYELALREHELKLIQMEVESKLKEREMDEKSKLELKKLEKELTLKQKELELKEKELKLKIKQLNKPTKN